MTAVNDPFPGIFAAVPGWITKAATWTPAEIRDACEDIADLIAGGGAMVLFDAPEPKRRHRQAAEGPPEPTTADIAAAVARGLGILALAPSGVTALGLHWCATPHDGCAGPGMGRRFEVYSQKATGAYYTPRFLAEQVTDGALEPLVYEPGPLQTADRSEWRLRSSVEIIALNVGDIAVGAGSFPVAAVRYLAARVMEAWAAEGREGDLTAARRAVLRCLHGADINAAAVELAKVALWLITFDPRSPHPPLDRQFAVGDSLLGITDLDQLAWMHVFAERGKDLHAGAPGRTAFPRRLATCVVVVRGRLTAATDPAEATGLRAVLDVLAAAAEPIADLVTGAALAGCGKKTQAAQDREIDRLSLEAARLAAHAWDHAPAPAPAAGVGLVPVVYAAPHNGTGDWHVADPAASAPVQQPKTEPRRAWVMCGHLFDEGDLIHRRDLPDGAGVCGACQSAVTAADAFLTTIVHALGHATTAGSEAA